MTVMNVILIGSPGAGKSNLLFRSWFSINQRKSASLLPRGLPEELTYLNEGVETQVKGKYVNHTPVSPDVQARVPVRIGGVDAELMLPDGPGEDWMRLYRDRRLPSEWVDLGVDSAAFLICLRADKSDQNVTDWIAVQRYLGHEANFDRAEDQTTSGVSAQVVVIDWIQMIIRIRSSSTAPRQKPRIGIVLTAWDVVADADVEIGPKDFLLNEFSMLSEFIKNNAHAVDFEVFGTSLYGVDLNDPELSKKVQESDSPSSMGWSVRQRNDGSLQRLTVLSPVEWAVTGVGDF